MARHKKKKKRGGGGRRGSRAKFAKVARHCWTKLRAGQFPTRGQFKDCMKKGLK